MLDFTEKNKKTLRVLRNTLSKVQKKEFTLVGAHYQSNFLLDSIPISTLVEDLDVDVKNNLLEGTIYFRPVGNQIRTLKVLREAAEKSDSLGEFLDTRTGEAPMTTSFKQDYLAGGSVLSNIQEIPFRALLDDTMVYEKDFKIAGTLFKQIAVQSYLNWSDEPEDPQQLTFLFKEKEYDGETLLGWLNLQHLTGRDKDNVLSLFVNGILTEKIIGSVMVVGPDFSSFVFPVFSDVNLSYNPAIPNYIIKTDTGVVTLRDYEIKAYAIKKVQEEKFELQLTLKSGATILISIG